MGHENGLGGHETKQGKRYLRARYNEEKTGKSSGFLKEAPPFLDDVSLRTFEFPPHLRFRKIIFLLLSGFLQQRVRWPIGAMASENLVRGIRESNIARCPQQQHAQPKV